MKERKNVYNLPQGDTTLEWYAKAVLEMQKRPTTDPTSWNFQAAMHGFDGASPFWANASPLPTQSEMDEYWNQCQHGSWYFLPWHRMYLAYFEQIVASTIESLGGPANWALPFWNYSELTNPDRLDLPQAFISPANSGNGLWIVGRASNSVLARDVRLGALKVKPYTGDGRTKPLGFGGPETGFSHSGSTHGRLESKPHDLVHVDIGGAMGKPRTAALDPIFWLHHANIDRLWQVWLNQGGRHNPTQSNWLNRSFPFHDSHGQPVSMTSMDVLDTTQVLSGYTYEGVPATPPAPTDALNLAPRKPVTQPLEVVGATNTMLPLSSNHQTIDLPMLPSSNRAKRLTRLSAAAPAPAETYLHFENVVGSGVPCVVDVYLNVPDGQTGSDDYFAGALPFFGIHDSSTPSIHHSGTGQHYAFDISELANELRTKDNWREDHLSIRLEPRGQMEKGASVTIGRISLYHHE